MVSHSITSCGKTCQGDGLYSMFGCFEARVASVVCHQDKRGGKGSCGRVRDKDFKVLLVSTEKSCDFKILVQTVAACSVPGSLGTVLGLNPFVYKSLWSQGRGESAAKASVKIHISQGSLDCLSRTHRGENEILVPLLINIL